jgi:dipeptidyl aminopeptidase/acylaminoacyl peptidase
MAPRIAPDGSRIAFLAPVDGVVNLWVGGLDLADARPVTNDTQRGLMFGFEWAADSRHLIYSQDSRGDENWRVHVVDVESGLDIDATPFDGVQAKIVKVSRRHPDRVLIALNRNNPVLHDPYVLNLATGELAYVEPNPGFTALVSDFVADEDLNVRAGLRTTEEGGIDVLVRDEPLGRWRTLQTVGFEDSLTMDMLLGLSDDGNRLLMRSSVDAPAERIIWVDLATGAQTVVAADDHYDVGSVLRHPTTGEIDFVTVARERREILVVNPSLAADIERLGHVHDGEIRYLDRTHDDTTWIVGFASDDSPGAYYRYDRRTGGASLLFESWTELKDYILAKCVPFRYVARDGVTIHGYLTFPPQTGLENLPTVLDVHGGPWGRDMWGFDPDAQLLANRGYLVVQVNFRGSTGYGKEFLNLGNHEWGGRMHDDLIDAVGWVVDQGYADKEKIAIYGHSYGGYAALIGAAFTPDVFACAVDIMGPSNLATLIQTVPPYWTTVSKQFRVRVGDPDTEPEFCWSRSPLSKVDQIKIPVMVVQGANDPRVKQAESDTIVAALAERGIPHEYLLFPDEGHVVAKKENSLYMRGRVENFLAGILGGRAEGLDDQAGTTLGQ